jgi:hypothetical protein
MSEITTLVRTHLLEYRCDKCNNGNMMPNGSATTTYPQRYGHVCTSCGNTEQFDHIYPQLKYEKLKIDLSNKIVSN